MNLPARCSVGIAVILLTTLLGTIALAEQRAESSERRRALKLTEIDGQSIEPFADSSTEALVLFFVSSDCPVANAFQPSLAEFYTKYAAKGVVCVQVHCSSLASADEIKKHVNDFGVTMPVVLDSSQVIGRLAGAKVTPEAVVIDRSGAIRYRGAINNLYANFGKKRRVVTAHYLRDAVDALLARQPVPVSAAKPVGCIIRYAD